MYYDYSKIKSYKAVFNFIIGARGCGKSYGAKKMLIKKFIRTGQQFIYLRRFKTELQKVNTWFDDVQAEFPDHEFKVKGKTFYIDGKLAGWAIALSTSQIEKQNSYKHVKYIMFDEFLIDTTGSYHYLRDEYNVLCQFYSTVDRDRDEVQVLFIGNALQVVNPYFTALGVKPDPDNIFVKQAVHNNHKYNLVTCEVFADPDQVEHARQTRFGLTLADTDISRFMWDNQFVLDNTQSVVSISSNPRRYKHLINIKYKSSIISIDLFKSNSALFINSLNMFQDMITYTLDVSSVTSDIPLLHQHHRVFIRDIISRYLATGSIFYDSVETKQAFGDIVGYLGIRSYQA